MSLTLDIASPTERAPQHQGSVELPAGTVVVSADSHWSVADDIFYESFPKSIQHKAPRIVPEENGFNDWRIDGVSLLPEIMHETIASFEGLPGATQIGPRMADLDIEGVDKEIAFGNQINLFVTYPDLEVRDWIFRIYNEHLAETAKQAPGRFFPIGFINYWDPTQAYDSVAELVNLGLKGLQLPITPIGAHGEPINYVAPEMEPLWQALEDAGLPVCFHVGEHFADGPGQLGKTTMMNFGPFRKNLGELIFGGILDRYPRLKIAFVEAEINWIPGALQTAERIFDCLDPHLDPKIKRRPTEYWHSNCYATFIHDPVGMKLLTECGPDRVMWSNDYPHPESAFGFGWSSIEAVVDATNESDAKKILGGTALRLFDL